MDNCQDRPTFLPETLWKALMNLPALRYMKAPVDNVAQLYEKYPIGNEKGTFAFVHDENTFYIYHPRGWHRGEWKPIAGGIESFFEIDAELLKEGDILVYDSTKKKFVVKPGNAWNKLVGELKDTFSQVTKFLNQTEEIPTDESDSGVYFVHKDEEEGENIIEFRALYIVLGKKAIKIWNSSDYKTKAEVESELSKKANQTQVDDIAASVDVLAVTKAEKSVVDALMNGIIKQPAVDTYNDTSEGKTSLLSQYPNPQKGWDVLVREENTRYNWNGTQWVNMESGSYDEDVEIFLSIVQNSLFGKHNYFDGLVESNRFLGNDGKVNTSATYNGILTDYIAVAAEEMLFFDIAFPFQTVPAWGCIWGYSDNKGNNPVKLKAGGTFSKAAVMIPSDGSVKFIRACHGSTSAPITITPFLTGTANIAEITSLIAADKFYPKTTSEYFISQTGGLSSSVGYVGYLSDFIPVKKGEKYLIRASFNQTWSNIWGYPSASYSNPIDIASIKEVNKPIEIEIPDGVNFLKVCSRYNSDETPCIIRSDYDRMSIDKLNQLFINYCIATNTTIAELRNRLESGVGIADVTNGSPIVYGNVSNFTGARIAERNIEEDYLVYFKSGTGNDWITSPIFNPLGANLVHIKFDVEFEKVNTNAGLTIWIAENRTDAGKFKNLVPVTENGSVDITIDPAYYTVYEGYTQFCFWINNQSMTGADSSVRAKISNLRVVEYENSVNAVNIEGNNAKELFESTDNALSEIKNSLNSEIIRVSPLGNKFELGVTDIGVFVGIPLIPTKAVFFGNSLIAGFGYGMAASQEDKDYYYLITEFIKTLNPAFTSSRLRAGGFEALTDPALVDSVIQNDVISQLTGDETLVSIQLGDNVNTPEKNAVFPVSSLKLCQAIRIKCPNARVVWQGMWYPSAQRYQNIQDACSATGSKFISYSDIRNKPNVENKIGNITKRGAGTRILVDVSNVTDNSATNITVTFAVSGTTYNTTLDVSSYSLSGSNLTYTSEYEIISSSGVASHPSDEGFRLISNKFIYEMGLTNDTEYYK